MTNTWLLMHTQNTSIWYSKTMLLNTW